MDIQFENISVKDCLEHGLMKQERCRLIFGDNVDWSHLSNWRVTRESYNHFVWSKKCSKSSLASSIYNWLNADTSMREDVWVGWSLIWKLHTFFRGKCFIWRMVHGRTPTFAYIYRLKVGPMRECCCCGLEIEIVEHVLWKC